jgi:hypothetical protein
MTDVLKSRRALRRENRDLRIDAALRDKREAALAEQCARTREDLKSLRAICASATCASVHIDSAEVHGLKTMVSGLRSQVRALVRRVEQRDRTIAGLSSQLDHALGYTAEEIAILDARKVRVAS